MGDMDGRMGNRTRASRRGVTLGVVAFCLVLSVAMPMATVAEMMPCNTTDVNGTLVNCTGDFTARQGWVAFFFEP